VDMNDVRSFVSLLQRVIQSGIPRGWVSIKDLDRTTAPHGYQNRDLQGINPYSSIYPT
jgi:hypothetical protein